MLFLFPPILLALFCAPIPAEREEPGSRLINSPHGFAPIREAESASRISE